LISNGSASLIGVCEEAEREDIYRRADDGSNPKIARIERVNQRKNVKGHITVLGESGIHRICNDFSAPSRSIHVYGRDYWKI
jgi:predicted metal-dependent enzyme (double-stranded beta helix superfamily)